MNSEPNRYNPVQKRQIAISWSKLPEKNAQDVFSGLSLPGFRNLMDAKKSNFRKRIWLVIFLCCFCLSVFQITERVRYFLDYPVSMTMEIKNSSNEVRFPRLCLCSQSQFNSNAILAAIYDIKHQNGTNQHGYNNLTAEKLWDMSGLDFKAVVENCTFGIKSCNSEKYWQKMYTVLGRCFLLNLAEVIRYHGIASGIQLILFDYDVDTLEGSGIAYGRWKILLYDDTSNVQYDILSKGLPLYKNARTQLMYWRKEYYFENTPTHPCVPAIINKKCKSECLNSLLLNGRKCKLPFMQDVPPTFPSCNMQEVADIYSVFPPFYIFDTNVCNCGNPCYETSFDVQPDSRNAFALFQVGKNKSRSVIDIYPSRPDIEVIKEIRAYTLDTLFSDIGGALGLYLGTSILTFFEIIQTIIKAIMSRVK